MIPYLENNPRLLTTSYRDESYNFPAHFHNRVEIVHCIEGKQKVKLGEETYTLLGGDTLLISPNIVHEYIECEDEPGKKTQVMAAICEARLLSVVIPDIATKNPKNPLIPAANISENAKIAIQKILETKSSNNYAERMGWIFVLISYVLDNIEFVKTDAKPELPLEIVAYIESNFKEDLTIKSIAKVFGYHPSYIAHIFCDQLKIPFKTYLGWLRSEYAATLIRATKKSLTEIAYESGFNSLNTFYRAFKKHFSQTPSEYKKEFKNRL